MRTASFTQSGIPTDPLDFNYPRLFDGVNLFIFDSTNEFRDYITATGTPGPTGSAGEEDTISLIIDATPDLISVGKKGKKIVENDYKVTEWYLVSSQTGSIQFDVSRSTFNDYPTTTSIVNGLTPSLTNQLKNSQTDITSWGTLSFGDIIEISVSSNTDVKNVSLFLKLQQI